MKILKFFSLSPNDNLLFTVYVRKAPGLFGKINMCVNIGKTQHQHLIFQVTNIFEKYLKGKGLNYLNQHTSLHFNYGLDENKLILTLIKINKISQIPKEHRHIF